MAKGTKKVVKKELTPEEQLKLVSKIQNDINGVEDNKFDFEKFDEHEFGEKDKIRVKDLLPVDLTKLTSDEIDELRNTETRILERTFVHVQGERIQIGGHLLARYRGNFPITKKMQELYFNLEKYENVAKDILIDHVQTTDMWKYFFKNVKGIGERLAGALMAEIGKISNYNTVSKVFANWGMIPDYWLAECSCPNPKEKHKLMLSSNTHQTCPVKIRSNEVEVDENGLKAKNRKGEDKMKQTYCGYPLTYLEHVVGLSPKRMVGYNFMFNKEGKKIIYICVGQFLKNGNETYTNVYRNKSKDMKDYVVKTFVLPFKEQINAPILIEESKKRAITVDSLRVMFQKIEDEIDKLSAEKAEQIKSNTKEKNKAKKDKKSEENFITLEIRLNDKIKSFNDKLKVLRSKLPTKYVTTREIHDRMNKKEGKSIKGYLIPIHIHLRAQRKTGKIFIENMYRVWRVMEGLPIRKPYAFDILGHTGDIMIPPWDTFFQNFNYETNKTTIDGVEMDWKQFVNSNYFTGHIDRENEKVA